MAFIDYTEAFFWTLTYIIIALTGIINKNEKRICIPLPTLWINFSWEAASVIYSFEGGFHLSAQGDFIRFSWFFFDLFILFCFFQKNKFSKSNLLALIGYLSIFVVLAPLFFYSFIYHELGMPITAFIIDALMEIFFWFHRKKLDPSNRLLIGITKILGDLFAGIYYGPVHPVVVVLACVAFCFDVLYIIFAIKERKLDPKIDAQFIESKKALVKKVKIFLMGEKQHQKKRNYKKKQKNKKTHRKKRKKV